MTFNLTKWTMQLGSVLLLAFLVAVTTSTAAFAQDDQEYKRAFNAGKVAADAKKYDEAYTQFDRALQLARAAGDDAVVKTTSNVLSKLDYMRGTRSLKADQHEQALVHYDKGIAHDATYSKNYYGKGLALKNLERIDEAMAAFKMAMEGNDRKVANTAQGAIRDYYGFLASSALSRNGERANTRDADEAMAHITKMQEFVEVDADGHYYMAESHKIKGALGACVTAADEALTMSRGSRTDKAKIYFVKGECLMKQGNIADAKAAFQNAVYGSYKATAQHYLETLGTN